MDSVVEITEERAPLLNSTADGEIQPSTSDQPPDRNQRLTSLDVFRGLTVALMILVDDAGGKFPSINHSPWFGVTLADFVMPFFLFGVGVSISLVFKKSSNKLTATKKVTLRTLKLFLLGVLLQGGYFHGRNHLTYGVDITHMRWLGVLQRISIGYFLAAMSEIWLVGSNLVDSPVSFMKKYYVEWLVAILLSSMYISLLYGLYVPNWVFDLPSNNSTLSFPNYGLVTETVQCGVSGKLGPPCNAVGFLDRLLLGENHLYKNPVYKRTKECSVNSPDYGPLPANAPEWCVAPFDPEGILSSVMSAVTCFAGLHFGHLIVHLKSHTRRMLLWSTTSLLFSLCGIILQTLGMPLSKPLYTFSYMLLTTGVSGFLLTLIYYTPNVGHQQLPHGLKHGFNPRNDILHKQRSSVVYFDASMERATKWDSKCLKPSNEVSQTFDHLRLLVDLQMTQASSVESKLMAELDWARDRISKLETKRHSSKKKMEHILKKHAEEKASWRIREHGKIQAIVDGVNDDLSFDRKNRRRAEILNTKLLEGLTEAKKSAKRFLHDYEKEKRAQELLEDVCDQLAKEVGEDRAEVEESKRESIRAREELEEREMLQMAEVWREERVQMKLIDARLALENQFFNFRLHHISKYQKKDKLSL